MTGLKHYLGPFEAYGQGEMPDTPVPRGRAAAADTPNFYYAQEDELFAAAAARRLHLERAPRHTVFGLRHRQRDEHGAHAAVYATICRELGRPFVFPGSETQWNGLTDVTDADLLAEQMMWAATDARGRDEAFNIANGDVFRWRWLWPRIAELLRPRVGGLRRRAAPAGGRDGRHEDAVARDRGEARSRRARSRPARVVVAHRRRPRPRHRGPDRHDQEPQRRASSASRDTRESFFD